MGHGRRHHLRWYGCANGSGRVDPASPAASAASRLTPPSPAALPCVYPAVLMLLLAAVLMKCGGARRGGRGRVDHRGGLNGRRRDVHHDMRGRGKGARLLLLVGMLLLILMILMRMVVLGLDWLNRRLMGTLGDGGMPLNVLRLRMVLVEMMWLVVVLLSASRGAAVQVVLVLLNRMSLNMSTHAGTWVLAVMLGVAVATLALIKPANERHGRRAADHRHFVLVRG